MVACTSKPWHKQKSAMIWIWNASRKLVCWRLGVEFVVLIGNGRTFMRQDLGEGVRSLAAYCSQERPWPFSLCSFAFCCSFEQFCFSACSLLWCAPLPWVQSDRARQSQLKCRRSWAPADLSSSSISSVAESYHRKWFKSLMGYQELPAPVIASQKDHHHPISLCLCFLQSIPSFLTDRTVFGLPPALCTTLQREWAQICWDSADFF